MTTVVDEGVLLSRTLFQRERLIRFDDILRIEGGRLHLAAGSIEVEPEVARQVSAVLAPLAAPGVEILKWGASLEARLAGPFGAQWAAQALLDTAQSLAASDLHLEAGPTEVEIRLRREGELEPLCRLGAGAARRIIAAWKGSAGCLPYRSDVVQEGRIERQGVAADVRASFIPTAFGERVALRLFGRLHALADLGLETSVRAALERALTVPAGLLLVAGSSGSGKTTLMYASLAALAQSRKGAHLSIEDPIEQRLRLAGTPVDQVELCPERGITGESLLAAALRQDVDVLAVGEIRTGEEARLAVRAAHTGRLVLAGVHAGSPSEARDRLLDLGADPQLLANTLRGIIHLTLSPAACDCGARPECPTCRGRGRTRRLHGRWLEPGAARLGEVAA